MAQKPRNLSAGRHGTHMVAPMFDDSDCSDGTVQTHIQRALRTARGSPDAQRELASLESHVIPQATEVQSNNLEHM